MVKNYILPFMALKGFFSNKTKRGFWLYPTKNQYVDLKRAYGSDLCYGGAQSSPKSPYKFPIKKKIARERENKIKRTLWFFI